MATDPICGMEVDERSPPGGKSDYQGTTYYSCGSGCKRTFDADPAEYAANA